MLIWGVMPIYWKALVPVNSYVIVLYRILFTGITCGIVALKVYGADGIKAPLKNKKTTAKLLTAGFLVTLNWNTYIYAVNSGQTIEASIGYYINPLVVCVLGIIFFKERPTKYKFISIIFACIGVLIILIHFMKLPAIALILAITFAIYAAIKKHLNIQAIISLFYETVIFAVIAFVIIVYLEATGQGAVNAGAPYQLVMLFFVGIATATPLTLFTMAANRVSLISLGIIEYIGPSISLLIGIFLFKEAFDLVQFIACVVIWTGLVFFTYGEVKNK
jgi:chloramphenicol-sensitive protein RarD